jgi:hypothetical protein
MFKLTSIQQFLELTEGDWYSQRRYYYLTNNKVCEFTSNLSVTFLPWFSKELDKLSIAHKAINLKFTCGAILEWETFNIDNNLISNGKIIMGVNLDSIYRDKGYGTDKPVVSRYILKDNSLILKTNYDNNDYTETIKMLSPIYRTRQTEMKTKDKFLMIGQYLEQKL